MLMLQIAYNNILHVVMECVTACSIYIFLFIFIDSQLTNWSDLFSNNVMSTQLCLYGDLVPPCARAQDIAIGMLHHLASLITNAWLQYMHLNQSSAVVQRMCTSLNQLQLFYIYTACIKFQQLYSYSQDPCFVNLITIDSVIHSYRLYQLFIY